MARGGAQLNFKNNNRLFFYSFYGFAIFYLFVLYFLFEKFPNYLLDKFPIKGFYPFLFIGIFLCFVFSFSIKYLVERFIQKRNSSIFLQK